MMTPYLARPLGSAPWIVALALAGLTGPAGLAEAQDQGDTDWLAAAQKLTSPHPVDAFDYQAELIIDAEDERMHIVATHAGGETGEDAWTVTKLETAGAVAGDDKADGRAEIDNMALPSYEDIVGGLEGARLIREDDQVAVYRIAGLDSDDVPLGDVGTNGTVDLEGLPGEVIVRKTSPLGPYVESVEVALPERVGWRAVASLEDLGLAFRFTVEPSGQGVLPSHMTVDVAGKVLYFFGYDAHIQIDQTGFRLAAAAADEGDADQSEGRAGQ
ncbi:hypothetical protein CCR85_12765 [Rhodothalassium salexigens]|uniref:hypothetical protein n=1 Tax=Rhodothalassium salexigens TaxID=1086 RepID=UPI001911E5C3|nr:hypothetical protein [Rhodothalassium salexigens]MBK5912358.1 hypothetical protein [Rhodothalassium salexigens]MBK5921488.1 hypothetical protein [Rhodothalassium salexigens]